VPSHILSCPSEGVWVFEDRLLTLEGKRRYTRSANLPGGTGIRVLVVDDYPDNVESMALLLRLCGYSWITTCFPMCSTTKALPAWC
jgi:hypothetical protein